MIVNHYLYIDYSCYNCLYSCYKDGHQDISNTFHFGQSYHESYISESAYTLVSAPGVITNVGYPFQYMLEQAHVWHIKFQKGEFIRLMFSNISLLATEVLLFLICILFIVMKKEQ